MRVASQWPLLKPSKPHHASSTSTTFSGRWRAAIGVLFAEFLPRFIHGCGDCPPAALTHEGPSRRLIIVTGAFSSLPPPLQSLTEDLLFQQDSPLHAPAPGHFPQVQLAAGASRSTVVARPEQEAPTTGAGASVDHWDEGALLGGKHAMTLYDVRDNRVGDFVAVTRSVTIGGCFHFRGNWHVQKRVRDQQSC
jgi:hypothetical protein